MALTRSGKIRLALGILLVVVAIAAWQGFTYASHYGYARGTVTGLVRKVSVHGPPYCKILTGELVLQGADPAQKPEIFNFSVEDDRETNPVVQDLHQAERSGSRVTLDYRQDVKAWWRCNPSEFFITAVEK
jgi:hypothetical protein